MARRSKQADQALPSPTNDTPTAATTWDVAEAVRLRLKRGMSYGEISARLGVPKGTIYSRLNNILGLLDDPQANAAYTSQRVDILTATERMLVGQLADPDRVKKASLNNVAYAFSQVHNARRLESGLSTENTDLHVQYANHVKARDTRGELVQAIMDRLDELGETCDLSADACDLPTIETDG